MLVTSANSILSIHLFEWARAKYGCNCRVVPYTKFRCRKLIHLRKLNHSVNTTSFFLTNPQFPRHGRQTLIPRLITIDESLDRKERNPWIRELNPIFENFKNGSGSADREILMDQRIGGEFPD